MTYVYKLRLQQYTRYFLHTKIHWHHSSKNWSISRFFIHLRNTEVSKYLCTNTSLNDGLAIEQKFKSIMLFYIRLLSLVAHRNFEYLFLFSSGRRFWKNSKQIFEIRNSKLSNRSATKDIGLPNSAFSWIFWIVYSTNEKIS